MNMAWIGASAWTLLRPNAIQRVLYKPDLYTNAHCAKTGFGSL